MDEFLLKDVGFCMNFILLGLELYIYYDVVVQVFMGVGEGEKSRVMVMIDEIGELQGRGNFFIVVLGLVGIIVCVFVNSFY